MATRISTTRRTVLKAAPAAMLSVAAPAAAASPMIAVLFEEWRSLRAAFPHGAEDEIVNAYVGVQDELVERMVAIPVHTLADLAMKIVATEDLEFILDDVRAEAAALVEFA